MAPSNTRHCSEESSSRNSFPWNVYNTIASSFGGNLRGSVDKRSRDPARVFALDARDSTRRLTTPSLCARQIQLGHWSNLVRSAHYTREKNGRNLLSRIFCSRGVRKKASPSPTTSHPLMLKEKWDASAYGLCSRVLTTKPFHFRYKLFHLFLLAN